MKRTVWGIVLLGLIASSAHAIVITAPTGLNPGDQYRLVFVTSTTRDATSSNIADYNAFVTGVANSVTELAALGTTWTAIGSTLTVDARDNTGTNPATTGVPIYLLNDTKLADNNADLWDGSIDVPLSVREDGSVQAGTPFVFTGSASNGVVEFLSPLGGNSCCTNVGQAGATNGAWIAWGSTSKANTYQFNAISGVLTMTVVPVPGAVWLFGSALGLMGVMRRKISS